MNAHGDSFRFEATRDGERRAFVLRCSHAARSRGWKLLGYDPDRNTLNQLEDFGIEGRPSLAQLETAAKSRISFYVGDGWNIRYVGQD